MNQPYGLQEHIKVTGRLELILRDARTGKIKAHDIITNMVVTAAKQAIAQGLRGHATAGEITYCATGTNTTAPALADVALVAEIARKVISVREDNSNSAVFRTFFTTDESNGTLREMALFGNSKTLTASATLNSGQLFCRAAVNRTKTVSDTLSVQWIVTIG